MSDGLEALGECDEVFDAEALGAEVEDRVGAVETFRQQRLQGVPQGLAFLSESGFGQLEKVIDLFGGDQRFVIQFDADDRRVCNGCTLLSRTSERAAASVSSIT